jgi:hypothetical protein
MPEKKMLILDQEILDKIDEYRGDLSRAEFLGVCIDTCLEEAEPEPWRPAGKEKAYTTSAYATKEDLDEFKRSIKDLLRAFMDFYISFGLELGTGNTSDDLGHLKDRFRTTLESDDRRRTSR